MFCRITKAISTIIVSRHATKSGWRETNGLNTVIVDDSFSSCAGPWGRWSQSQLLQGDSRAHTVQVPTSEQGSVYALTSNVKPVYKSLLGGWFGNYRFVLLFLRISKSAIFRYVHLWKCSTCLFPCCVFNPLTQELYLTVDVPSITLQPFTQSPSRDSSAEKSRHGLICNTF